MQKSGKILVATQHYPPDSSTTAVYIAAIAERLAVGNKVVVLSGSTNSASAAGDDPARPDVIEVRNWIRPKDALVRRAIAIALFALRMFFSTLTRASRHDAVFCVTTPFTLPYAVVLAAKLRGAATMLIYDIYSEALEAAALIRPRSFPARLEGALRTAGSRQATQHNPARSVPQAELVEFLSAADVWVIPYRRNIAGVSIPSRMYNLLAVGRAIIVIAEPHAEAALVVNEETIGWAVTPEDPAQLANAIRLTAADRAATTQTGRRAAVAAEKYSEGAALARCREIILERPDAIVRINLRQMNPARSTSTAQFSLAIQRAAYEALPYQSLHSISPPLSDLPLLPQNAEFDDRY